MGLGVKGIGFGDKAVFEGFNNLKEIDALVVGQRAGHLQSDAGIVEFVDLFAEGFEGLGGHRYWVLLLSEVLRFCRQCLSKLFIKPPFYP